MAVDGWGVDELPQPEGSAAEALTTLYNDVHEVVSFQPPHPSGRHAASPIPSPRGRQGRLHRLP